MEFALFKTLIKRILVFSCHKRLAYTWFDGNSLTSSCGFLYRIQIAYILQTELLQDTHGIGLPKLYQPEWLLVPDTIRVYRESKHLPLDRKGYRSIFLWL